MNKAEAAALRAPFPPESIGQLPKGGVMLDFCGHAAVTDRLLAVDPDWTWEPMVVGPNGEPLIVNGGLWIRLTVCGVTRPGWGDGKSVKEMIGDALRNAAMRFGVALDLWSRQELTAAQDSAGASTDTGAGTAILPEPPAAEPAGTGPAAPAEQSQYAKPGSGPITEAQKKRINILVAKLTEGDLGVKKSAIAASMKREHMIETDEDGVQHFGRVRDDLSQAEARDLIGRLERRIEAAKRAAA